MALSTDTPLTHRERLARGLAYSAAGPVDVARGAAGLGGAAVYRGAAQVYAGAAELRRRYRESRLAQEIAEAAAELPALLELPTLLDDRPAGRLRRGWVIAGAAAAALLAGGVVAVLIYRSRQAEEPSPRPPSVDAQPKI